MNREIVLHSLDALRKIAERVERSRNPSHHMLPITAQTLGLDIKLHVTILRREFDKVAKVAALAKAT